MVEVIPVSDPNAATMSQKVVQYQAVLQLAQTAPLIYDMPALHRQMLEVLGIKDAAKLVPLPEDQKPRDPVSENMNVLNSKPVKAFIYQDHQAHITVHMAAMQDPKIQQMVGQNPTAPAIQAAMMAHVNEHIAFEYRRQIEEMLGVKYPEPDEDIPKDMEVEISRLAAAGAQKLLQKSQAEVAQQQANQAAQDPVVQMQQQELQIKAKETEIKEKKLMVDAAAKADQLDIERERIASQERVAGMQVGARIATDKANLSVKQQMEGLRIGLDAAREASQEDQQLRQAQQTQQPKGEQ
jgi:hypothetical protein